MLSAFRNFSKNMSSSCCLTSCGTSTKFFNVGPQHPLLNLLRHQNFFLGPKSIHKYHSKCHSFFLPPVISCKFYPLLPQAFFPPDSLFANHSLPSPPQAKNRLKLHHPAPTSKHISNTVNVYRFPNTEP